MRVLVTGGAGYIGSVVAAQLVAAGHEVTVLDDLSTGYADAVPPGATFVKGTLRDCSAEVLSDGIEAVLHFAAKSLVGESVADPAKYWSNNLGGTVALLEAMREMRIRTIVFSSTAAVYGEPERTPITETDPTRPTSPYGASKIAVDTTLGEFCRLYGFGAVSLRYFNVAGAHAGADGGNWLGERHNPETHLIPNVLASVTEGRRVQIFGDDYPTPDGTCVRDYIHVTDLADAHLRALAACRPGQHRVYNLGNGEGFSVREVVQVCREVTGADIGTDVGPRRAGDPAVLVASSAKIAVRAGLAGREGPARHGRRRLAVHPGARFPVRAAELFRERFGGEPDGVWLAPGRANLMGEHTDYNDGYVLPFALGQGVTAAAARRPGRQLTLCSRQEPGAAVQIALDGLAPGQVTGWAAYPAGVAWALEAAGHPVPGACLAIDSDLPAGAGLSSSAALECSTALALTELAEDRPVSRRELAAIARRAENEFVGVPSGIMDQSASLLGQAGHALLLDCRSLEVSQVPFDPAAAEASLLLINTRAKHDLVDGAYGQRRAECEEAARRLGVSSLRSLTTPAEADRLADPVLRRRARHVVADNQRVLDVVALLSAPLGTPVEIYRDIGQLLTESHASLRDDFEISWPEADATVAAALAAGAFGARMMGGGFGGSVLALVPATAAGPVRDAVTAAFARHAWTAPEFLDAVPSASARRLTLQFGVTWCEVTRRRSKCRYAMMRPSSRARSPNCGTRSTASPRSAWTCRRRRPRCSTPWTGCRWRSAPARRSVR